MFNILKTRSTPSSALERWYGTDVVNLLSKQMQGWVFIGEDKHEATFECQYCRSRIAFALPGSGEPVAHGKPGAWEPDPEFAKWMDPCST